MMRFHNMGVFVSDIESIESWFEKIRAAGYRTQTDYVWPWAVKGKSFLFYDQDGNLIQFCEQSGTPSWRP